MKITNFSQFLLEKREHSVNNLFLEELKRVTDSLGIPWSDTATPRQVANGTAVLKFSINHMAKLFLESGLAGKSVSSNINSRCKRLMENPWIRIASESPEGKASFTYFGYAGQLRRAVSPGYNRVLAKQPSSNVDLRWDRESAASSRQAVTEFVCRSLRSDLESSINQIKMEMVSTTTSPEALLKLAADENHGVRYYAAGNPNTPVETLLKLAADEDDEVSSAAIASLPEDKKAKVLRLKQLGLL